LFFRRLEWLGSGSGHNLLRDGLRGVEKETLRVTPSGALSQRPHPRALGSALTHPSITTDYSEALLELVTPPVEHNWQTLQQLYDIHAYIHRKLDGELLWPMSMPCALASDDAIPIADYGTSNSGLIRTIYRRGLGHRYGRSMQAIAGVHFNFSPPEAFWDAWRNAEGASAPLQEFRSDKLMGLVRNYRRHAWLVIYLFGASPAFSRTFLPKGNALVEALDTATWYAPYATSLRMSDIGYQNKTQGRLQVSANSLDEYIAGLTAAVTTVEPRYAQIGVVVDGEYRQLNANVLQIENEYYSTIRPKPSKRSARTTLGLREHGVEYVEIRTLDLSPADPVGMNQRQLRFLETLLLYCLLSDSPPIDADETEEINTRSLLVARAGRQPGLEVPIGNRSVTLREAVAPLHDAMLELADDLDRDGRAYRDSVAAQWAAIDNPALTPSARLLESMRSSGASFEEYALDIARRHHDYFTSAPFDAATLAEFERLAEVSLRDQTEREAADTVDFDDYLADFLARV
jgi:glutamate--cysteine ligase